jgi:hypothetical protein
VAKTLIMLNALAVKANNLILVLSVQQKSGIYAIVKNASKTTLKTIKSIFAQSVISNFLWLIN